MNCLILLALQGSAWATDELDELMASPAPGNGIGDIYVVGPEGAQIELDDQSTGKRAPDLLKGVASGPHTLRLVLGCEQVELQVAVRKGAVERVEPALELGTGSLTVRSSPDGAAVFLGDARLGVTPLEAVEVPCGEQELRLVMAEHTSAALMVDIGLGQLVEISRSLEPESVGSIAVSVEPLTAEVWLNGRGQGTGPMTLEAIPEGEHLVSARLKGYDDATEVVKVAGSEMVRVELVLAEKPPPEPLAQRWGLDRLPWARIGVNSGVTATSAVLGGIALGKYRGATDSYGEYIELAYNESPNEFYERNVRRPRTTSYVMGGIAGAGIVTASVLWLTTDWSVVDGAELNLSPTGAAVQGTF